MAVRTVLKQPEKNSRRDPGERGWACYFCGKEERLKRDCPQASKGSPAPCLPVRGHTGGETAPRRVGPSGGILKTTRTECAQGSPQTPTLITAEEPQVLVTVGGQSVNFLVDTRASYSVLTETPGPVSPRSASVM